MTREQLVEKLNYVVKMARQYEAAVIRVPEAVHGADERLEQAKRELLASLSRTAELREDVRDMLLADNKRMRSAGGKLAEAAIYTVHEYDGLHRLSLAVAEWSKAVADEGHRAALSANNTREGDD